VAGVPEELVKAVLLHARLLPAAPPAYSRNKLTPRHATTSVPQGQRGARSETILYPGHNHSITNLRSNRTTDF